ncbi:allene oxide synthase-lipoxygenase protein-like [Mya arenaria]|uniref:allene oxide synthase-lipoxygenase protein-like n=1 Tax=Mya arenaria TaxID=6604 RepID=UPI0022E09C41|nr:allene oxide synthase-lipoxygenase protein-like [Mya arenaria]
MSKFTNRISNSLRRRSSLFAGFYNYNVYVQTGDHPRAGTDAHVYIVMHGQDGGKSPETKLAVLFRDNFDRGNLDKFKIKFQPFSVLDHIELWRDTAGFRRDWFVETIMIVNKETRIKTVFPIFRWIRPNYRYKFYPLDISLPQHDKAGTDQRRQELEEKRETYQLHVRMPGLPAQARTPLPIDEQFPADHSWDIIKQRTRNSVTSKFVRLTTSNWRSMDDVHNVFTRGLLEPSDLNRWNDDKAFGLQRLAGVNNSWIRVCKRIPNNFGVTEEMVAPFLDGCSLTRTLSDRRVFIVDHSILQNISTHDDCHVCAPMALFFEKSDGVLIPIAIQLFQDIADDNPVFLPSDSHFTWTLAKMWFNNADASIHLAVSHLGFMHSNMEGIIVAIHRQLSQSHPVYKLLAPHFHLAVAVNQRLSEKLHASGSGWLEEIMSINSEGFDELVRRHKTMWRMDIEGTLPADLRTRGVADTDILSQYYFRDDALALWELIEVYVTRYLKLYYTSDEDVAEDWELQAWRTEMVTPEVEGGLGLQGVPGDSDLFKKRSQITQVCCFIIYTCSAGHAATCFKQYDEYAFPPNYPTRLSGEPPRHKAAVLEQDVLDVLPGKTTMLDTMMIMKCLSEKHTKPLGDFETNYVFDPKAVKVVKDFKEDLKALSATIKCKNRLRSPPYLYLDPSEIPNSMCP